MERRTELKRITIALLALAFTMAIVVPLFAEDPAAAPAQAQAQQDEKALRKEIVKLKYVRADYLQNILYAYVGRGGALQFSPSMPMVIAVRDTPENVEKILAVI